MGVVHTLWGGESLIFAYRVSSMYTRSIKNMPYIKICAYVRIYIFLGSFAQPKCDGFWEWVYRSPYHTQEIGFGFL